MCCSIIGYCGDDGAAPVLVRGLKRMEYRGYDSVGVATLLPTDGAKDRDGRHDKANENDDNNDNCTKIMIRKGTGKVSDVNAEFGLDALPGKVGIGHTRWASHGKVTNVNAHPHQSSRGGVAIVHNGIIANFEVLRRDLENDGYLFCSDTDSEVIANLLHRHYVQTGDVKESMMRTVCMLEGEYAFVAMFEDDGTLAAARLHQPLVLGVGNDDLFISSDVLGFIEYTDEAVYVQDRNIVIAGGGGATAATTYEIFDFEGSAAEYEVTKVSKEFGDAYRGDYAHFTLREIYEQNQTMLKVNEGAGNGLEEAASLIRSSGGTVYLTGSGSSYNATLVAKYLFSHYAGIGMESIMSSELQFAANSIRRGAVLVAVSQSGESADVLNAVKIARNADCRIISIVNVLTSSLAHESDVVVGMGCGPEIGVAATKSFTSQLVVLYRIMAELAGGVAADALLPDMDDGVKAVAGAVSQVLENPAEIQRIAREIRDVSDIYVLGRGVHYPIAVEAALKIKELTYIHAEGIAGGELKHGPLALMDSSAYVIIINPFDSTYEETLTSAREIGARGAKIIGVSDRASDVYDYWIEVPSMSASAGADFAALYPVLEIVPIQILAYYAALERDKDPDYPRNLAKSVTVR